MSHIMSQSLLLLEKIVMEVTGKQADVIRKTPLAELRSDAERKNGGQTMQFKSYFPVIGRGNVLRDKTISRQQLEQELDEALKET